MTDIITLEPVVLRRIQLEIEGMTPLITHAWSEKAKKMMRDKQAGKATKKHPPKNPEAEAEAATYRLPDGSAGLPAVAIKAAMVGAARYYENLTLVLLRQSVFVEGEGPEQLLRIDGERTVREDMVRIGQGTSDLRYRPMFDPWKIHPVVEYSAQLMPDSIVNLVNTAGQFGGVGEWRPSSPKANTGTYGRFRVIGVKELG